MRRHGVQSSCGMKTNMPPPAASLTCPRPRLEKFPNRANMNQTLFLPKSRPTRAITSCARCPENRGDSDLDLTMSQAHKKSFVSDNHVLHPISPANTTSLVFHLYPDEFRSSLMCASRSGNSTPPMFFAPLLGMPSPRKLDTTIVSTARTETVCRLSHWALSSRLSNTSKSSF